MVFTLLFCMSLLALFLRSTIAASTLFTAAAQCRADLPEETKTRLLELKCCFDAFEGLPTFDYIQN